MRPEQKAREAQQAVAHAEVRKTWEATADAIRRVRLLEREVELIARRGSV